MEHSSTDRVTSWKTWGTVLAALVTSAIFVLGVTLGYSPFAAFRPTATDVPLGSQPPCMDIGMSGNAAWDRLTSEEYLRANEMTRELGMGRVRIGANWGEVEWNRGSYDWADLDMRVRQARSAGVVPLLVLQSVPDWLTIPTGPISPAHREAARQFGEFAREVAARYQNDVDGYEIYNEPNKHDFWPDPDVPSYFEVLKAAYPAIHAADSNATVITGGLAPAPDSQLSIAPLTFLTQLYDLGGGAYSDAIGMHPYSYPELPSGQSDWNTFRSLTDITRLMASRGDGDKKIWLTEFGAPTGGLGGVSPQQQAEIVVEAFQLTRTNRSLGPIFFYTLLDGDAPRTDPEYHFGLYYADLQPKLAVGALQQEVRACTS